MVLLHNSEGDCQNLRQMILCLSRNPFLYQQDRMPGAHHIALVSGTCRFEGAQASSDAMLMQSGVSRALWQTIKLGRQPSGLAQAAAGAPSTPGPREGQSHEVSPQLSDYPGVTS